MGEVLLYGAGVHTERRALFIFRLVATLTLGRAFGSRKYAVSPVFEVRIS